MAVFVVIFLTCVALDAGLMSVGIVRRSLSGHRLNRPARVPVIRAQSETPVTQPTLPALVAVGGHPERADARIAVSVPASGSVIKIVPASQPSEPVPVSAAARPMRQRRSMVKTLCPNC